MSITIPEGRRLDDAAEHRERQIAQARRKWSEYPANDLGVEGKYLFDKATGRLFTRYAAVVFHDHANLPVGVDSVDAFFVADDGEMVFLQKSEWPTTLDELHRSQREEREREERAQAEHRAWLESQPLIPVTLAQVEGDPNRPTIREAARLILDSGGRIEKDRDGRLRISLRERVCRHGLAEIDAKRVLHRAARVLHESHDVVLAELERGGRKPLVDRLPDKHPLVGGGFE